MKKVLHKTLLTIAALLCSIGAMAHDFEVDGIYYNIIDETDRTVRVTYRGGDYDSYDNEYTGSVVIPNSVAYGGTTYRVTSIGGWAFRNCTGLTSVTIPESVTSMGIYAFYGCTGLTEITIPGSVTSMGGWAFYNCTGLKSVTINSGVTSIGDDAFSGCSGLTEIIIPGSVTSIGVCAFDNCTGLESVTINSGVTSIGGSAFKSCEKLTSVTIPNSVTSIGNLAFYDTPYYNNMSDGVIYLGSVLYKYKGTMPANTNIVINEGTVSISHSAFSYCYYLTSITIPNSVTSIGGMAFYGCTDLTSVTIPKSVTSIGNNAFYNCTDLTTVYFNAENCATVGSGTTDYTVFSECANLSRIIIGESVKTIPNNAFYDCTGLTEITIPESVTSIGDYAFYNCYGMTEIIIQGSVTSIGDYAFYSCYGLTEVTIPESVTSIGSSAFHNCYYLTSITIPESVTSIGSTAFRSCGKLTSVTIPGSVTSIGDYTFMGCSGLASVTIPGRVTSIGSSAFRDCTGLASITIPESVTSIGGSAFRNCTGLASVTIGSRVTSIVNNAFYNCTGLTEITCYATNPPPSVGGSGTFDGVTKDIPVYVPNVSAYEAADVWKEFTNILPLDANITTENVYYLDCNDQTEWTVEAGSNVQAVFTNVSMGYEATVQGTVVQNTTGGKTYTSVLFYLAEGNSYAATNGVENARYSHVEFKLINPDAVTRSEETPLTTDALYFLDATKPIYRLATNEWVAYDPTATGIDEALAEDTIAVRGNIVTAQGDIYVYNMSGVIVAQGRDEIDLSALQRGIYLIQAGDTVKKVVR